MARSIKWLLAGLLTGALIVGLLFWFWLRTPLPSPEALAALNDWLNTNCLQGQAHPQTDALHKYAGELEGPLIDVFQKGPASSEIQRVENAARLRFQRTRDLVRSGADTGLIPSDKQALLAASVDAWAKRAGEEFASNRRAAALAGLGITGGSKGQRLLKQISDDPNSPFQEVARLASEERPSAATIR